MEREKVTLVGVGALGSHYIQFARNFDLDFFVIDFDRIEMKNVQSQFHFKSNMSKNKASSLQQIMNFGFGKKINVIPHKLVEKNATELLSGSKLVVDCLDNGASRRLVQQFVRKNNIPCLHGGLAADGSFGVAVWDHQFVIDDEPSHGSPTCENGNHLPFIALVSAYLAQSSKVFLDTGNKLSFRIHPKGIILT